MDKYIERRTAIVKLTALEVIKPNATMTDAKRLLADMPATDVAPVVHGRWKWETGDIYRCTNCNGKAHVKEVMNRPAWDFCPNCGVRMDGDGDG